MIESINRVPVTEIDGQRVETVEPPTLIVKCHRLYADSIVLAYQDVYITVIARDLEVAIANAKNAGGR